MPKVNAFLRRRHVRAGAARLAGLFCLSASLVGAALQTYTPDAATLHVWHFDESATPCVDAAPGGTNLTYLIGGASLGVASVTNDFASGVSFGTLTTSNAVLFPAGLGNVGKVIPFAYADAAGAFTFEAVVRVEFDPAHFVRDQPCQILNCDGNNTGGGARVFQFRLDPVGFGGGDTNVCRLEFINGVTTVAWAPIPTNGPDAIVSNHWYHVAVTYNGSANTTSNLLFYWTALASNAPAADCIYGVTMASDLPGTSNAATIFSIGNSARNPGGGSGPALANFLGSIDEVRLSSVARAANEFVFQTVSVLEATGTQAPNYPQNTLDGDLNTRWSAQGDGQYITYDLGRVELVQSVDLAFYQSSGVRTNWFDVLLSNDQVVWHSALTNAAGTNAALANFDFADWPARYVRYVGHLNSQNDFNSLAETVIHYSPAVDLDHDGLPDFWENYYFSNLDQTADGDPDGDAQSNQDEFLHGTDPTQYDISGDADADGLPDAWEIAHFGSITAQDASGDPDADGYANLQEYQAGSDPANWNSVPGDTDGDTQPDAWETVNLGGLAYGAYDDPDHDGYNNVAERLAGTNPLDAASHPSWAAPRVAFLRDSVVATNACLMPASAPYGRAINGISFQDQILLTFGGYQYTAWYDTVGTTQLIWLARRTATNTSVGPWQKFQTDSEFLNGDESAWDAHDVIALGICPGDGILHIAWDMHGQTLKYRRSVLGLCTTNLAAWGAGMLGPQTNKLSGADPVNYDASVTYPQFIATPDHKLMLDRRYGASGDGDDLLQTYDPITGTWSPNTLYISRTGNFNGSTSRNAYLNGFDFGPDGKIHVTWTWREGAGSANHDLCYAYSADNGVTWRNNAGALIADTSLGQSINLDTPGIIFHPLDTHQLLINQQAQCVDQDGRLHVLVLHRIQDPGYEYPNYTSANFSTLATAYYHYFRDPTTGGWSQRRLPFDAYPVGSRPKIVYDASGNVYAAYLSYSAGTDVVPGYTDGQLVIAGASKASQYTDWQVLQVLTNDFNGEPLIDQTRLLADNVLSVYIQENSPATSYVGTPLHVFDFAVNVPEPHSLALNFSGPDSLITLNAAAGYTYQLQAATTLSPADWSNVGVALTNQVNGLIVLPDPNGRAASRRFYRVVTDP